MGIRKTLWRRRIRQAGGVNDLHRVLPTRSVKATGAKAYPETKFPNSGAGVEITKPVSARKRALIEKWAVLK